MTTIAPPTTVVTPLRRSVPARLAADSVVVAGRFLRQLRRDPTLIVFTLLQPVLFVLLFRYAFGGAIATDGAYVDYLMPGIFVQTVTWGAIATGVGLAEDRDSGLTERLRALPMAPMAVLAGRSVADLVRNGAVVVVLVAMGLAVGFSPSPSLVDVVVAGVVLASWTLAASSTAALVGVVAGSVEATQAAMTPLLFPITFASSAFVPTATMPSWLASFAEHQPFTVVTDAVRGLLVTGAPDGDPWLAVLWSAAVIAIAAPLTVWASARG